ncbi:MAG: non-ribosomal peptide synthetase [Bacteroidota bacterium]
MVTVSEVRGMVYVTTISELLAARADRTPDAVAIAASRCAPLTYGGLHAQAENVSALLRSAGIRKSDVVAVAIPTGAQRLVLQLSVAATCSAVPVNALSRATEIEDLLARLGARAIIALSGQETAPRQAARRLGIYCIDCTPGATAGTFSLLDPRLSTAVSPGTEPGSPSGRDIALLMQTSGSTGDPKGVPLTHANLCAAAGNISRSLALGPDDTLLSVLQQHHIAGFTLPLAALLAGGNVFVSPGFDPDGFNGLVEEANPTWFWAAPAMLREIVRRAPDHAGGMKRSRLRLIRVGSAPLPAELKMEAERLFNVPVLENYGMTEASPQITTVPLPPAACPEGSVGRPVGIEVAIAGEDGSLLPPLTRGEIVIRGESVMTGYLGESVESASHLPGGWLRTGDQGYLDSDGYLFLTGRLKEMINRGGEKVAPLEVDRVLLSHPDVERAVTFPVQHPTLGEEIAAAVVLREGARADTQDLQRFALSRLSIAKVPRYIHILASIPSDERGKVRRHLLAEQLGLSVGQRDGEGGDQKNREAPRTSVERELVTMWNDVLRIDGEGAGINAHFLDLGGDSVSAAQIISRVRRKFNVDLSPIVFFEEPTIAGLAGIIETKLGAVQESPHAGGKER